MTDETEQTDRPGAGEQLRRAREEMGRSSEDMAGELRLTVEQVESLEAEAFDKLPGETYVRGYLRNYAAAVGLPPETVLEAYDQDVRGIDPGEEDQSPLFPEPERPLIDHPLRVAGISLLLLGVVSGATIWMVGQSGENGQTGEKVAGKSAGDKEPAPKPAPEGGAEAGSEDATAEGPASPGASPAATEEAAAGPDEEAVAAGPRTDLPPAPGQETGEGDSPGAGEEAGPEPAGTDTPSAASPGPEEGRPPRETGTSAFRGAGPSPTMPEDLQTLRIHTWAPSWIEVADARGNLLLRRLIESDHDLRLYGQPPFQVKVGNAAGVQLYYEGSPLPALGGATEVVRLTVDDESETVPESEVGPPPNLEEVKRLVRERLERTRQREEFGPPTEPGATNGGAVGNGEASGDTSRPEESP